MNPDSEFDRATEEMLAAARRIAVGSGRTVRQKRRKKPRLRIRVAFRVRYLLSALAIIVTAVVSGTASSFVTYRLLSADRAQEVLYSPKTIDTPVHSEIANTAGSISDVAKKVLSSVVTIQVFGSNGLNGSGSGVVFNNNGDIVTNAHVVTLDGRTENPTLRVLTRSGRRYKATLVGFDRILDLAVIRIPAGALPPVPFGDSSATTVGASVIAIGAPLGYDFTVTRGVVSATLRAISVDQNPFSRPFEAQPNAIPVIQTDAAINPGNSGGPLVNMEGKIIGINVAMASAGLFGGNTGLGFAIPSNLAVRIVKDLVEQRRITHGYMGIAVSNGDDANDSYQGATITNISPGGAADRAGLKSGDLLLSIGGNKISSMVDVMAFVRSNPAGSVVSVRIERGGQEKSVEVTLDSLEDSAKMK